MSDGTTDARKTALFEYGVQVLENSNNADEELQDKGKGMMGRYVEEVVRGQIELVREFTENAIDLESEERSDYEDDSYLATDDDGDDDCMDSHFEGTDDESEEEEEEHENEEYKDSLFTPEDAIERYAQSLASRGF